MITLYKTNKYPVYKILYDEDKCFVIGRYDYYGWTWTENIKKAEKILDNDSFEAVLSHLQQNRPNALVNYTKISYETWEDFVIDQL